MTTDTNQHVAGEHAGLRRRSTATTSQKAVIAGVATMGAILGLLGPGAPTGQSVIDGVYRALFIAGLALAASRARRWSVIVGSAIAAAGSLGLGLLFGSVALLMAVFLVGKDLRNRVYGAVIGVLIGMALLRLQVDWFLGASALIATVSAGLVFWSGYRVSRRAVRRNVRWALAGVAAVGVVGVGMSVYEAITFSSPLQSAVQSTIAGVSAVQNGKTSDGATSFDQATQEFRQVADDATRWWLFPARLVPVVSQNVEVISVMSEAGAELTQSAKRVATQVDYSRIRRPGGGVDLALLDQFTEPVIDASNRLASASADVRAIESPWVVAPLASRIDEFETKVADLRSQTDLAATALRYGPAMFGGSGERHYLVLLGNPAELRDLGGHIGNWAELSMLDGKISLVKVGQPLELAQPRLDDAVAESEDLPPSYLSMRPATFPQNWGASIDFPLDARVAARLYEAKVGRRMDGVLYADPQALAAMLQITGPLPVPGLVNRQISASDAVQFLTLDQFTAFAVPADGDRALTELVRNLFQKLTESTLPSPADLGRLFGPLVKEGRFRMVSLHGEDHSLLGLLGMDNGFGATDGDDLLAVVNRNANPSKIDTFLHRTTAYDVDWDPQSGAINARVSVDLRNDAPATGLPPYVIGNSADAPAGTNITDLAVITPFESTSVTVDGVEAAVTPLRDGDVWRHNVRVSVPPGGTVHVVFELDGDVDPGSTYRLHFSGQPTVVKGTTTVSVRADRGRIVPGPGIEVGDRAATATLSDIGQTILTLRERS
ncbi:MAG: DUF4012 domain-containing protein [Acidimicrobiales bacterium]